MGRQRCWLKASWPAKNPPSLTCAAPLGEARMDPRNGLCLSATDDAAFDRHLFTLDRYRLVLSKALALPLRYRPSQVYVEQHRAACGV